MYCGYFSVKQYSFNLKFKCSIWFVARFEALVACWLTFPDFGMAAVPVAEKEPIERLNVTVYNDN